MESQSMLPKQPELRPPFNLPVWFHHHADKIEVLKTSSNQIFLAGSAAQLTITEQVNLNQTRVYLLEWEIRQSLAGGGKVNGKALFTANEMKVAFGLSDEIDMMGSYWLIEKYGGEVARQGSFIRWEKYLNIPCPGTGHDGDPNISIYLGEKIRDAVKKLTS